MPCKAEIKKEKLYGVTEGLFSISSPPGKCTCQRTHLSYQSESMLTKKNPKKEKGLVLTSRVFAFLLQVPKHSAHAPFVPIVLHFRIITTKNKWQARSYNSTWSEGEASPYKQPFSTFHIFRNGRADFHSHTFFWSFLPQTPSLYQVFPSKWKCP